MEPLYSFLQNLSGGLLIGGVYALLGVGLSLIFGVMRIVNLSHGSYFLLGGYVALSVIWTTGSWLLAIPVAALAIAGVGLLMERLFLRSEGLEYIRNGLIGIGLAVLVCLARVHVGAHLPLDVVGGAALGATCACAVLLAGPARVRT